MIEKKFTKEQMLFFAEHCMIQLLSVPAEETPSGVAEITGENLSKISKVLGEYKKEWNGAIIAEEEIIL